MYVFLEPTRTGDSYRFVDSLVETVGMSTSLLALGTTRGAFRTIATEWFPNTRPSLEGLRKVILDLFTEFDCHLRTDLPRVVFEDPSRPARYESASSSFVGRSRYTESGTSKSYTYFGLTREIRWDFRHSDLEVPVRYGGHGSELTHC